MKRDIAFGWKNQGNPHMSVHVQRYLGTPVHVKKDWLWGEMCANYG